MTPEFTAKELHTICNWAMDAADKAKKKLPYWTEPYEEAKAIFEKVHKEYIKRNT